MKHRDLWCTALLALLPVVASAAPKEQKHSAAQLAQPTPSPAAAPPTSQIQEPAGLRLQMGAGDPRLVEWGVTTDRFNADYSGNYRGHSMPNVFMNTGIPGVVLCPAPYGWRPYFGSETRKLDADLRFYQDRFFAFSISFTPDSDYDFVLATMIQALGQPVHRETSTVQNRMGATFDQEQALWQTANVEVSLQKRSTKVDQGALLVTYKPFAPPAEPTAGKAPF